MQIREQIRQYIAKNLLFSPNFKYSDDASFLGEGIIDSIGVMEIVSFIEQEFKISVDLGDITPDNFDSVAKIAQYVERKHAPQSV